MFAQKSIDSLLQLLPAAKEDTNKVNLLYNIAFQYDKNKGWEKGRPYGKQGVELAKKINFKPGEIKCLHICTALYASWGNPPEALEYYNKCLEIDLKSGDKQALGNDYFYRALIYMMYLEEL